MRDDWYSGYKEDLDCGFESWRRDILSYFSGL